MKHFQAMTREALGAAADDTYETGTDNGDLTVFFKVSGDWEVPDSGPSIWVPDYSIIGAVHDLWEGGVEVFTEAEAEARFGCEFIRQITREAEEAAE